MRKFYPTAVVAAFVAAAFAQALAAWTQSVEQSRPPEPTAPQYGACAGDHVDSRLCPDGRDDIVDPNETRVPPGDYCMNHSERRMAPNAHECHCDYNCVTEYVDGHPISVAHEASDCKTYCHRNGRYCTCHPEDPCPKPA